MIIVYDDCVVYVSPRFVQGMLIFLSCICMQFYQHEAADLNSSFPHQLPTVTLLLHHRTRSQTHLRIFQPRFADDIHPYLRWTLSQGSHRYFPRRSISFQACHWDREGQLFFGSYTRGTSMSKLITSTKALAPIVMPAHAIGSSSFSQVLCSLGL